MSFDPALPKPKNENWRNNYGIFRNEQGEEKERQYSQRYDVPFSTYQAPGGKPVPFILDNIRLSGGQSVDTAEYAFHGLWSNSSLNEKSHQITINASLRGETYIRNRNALVEALRVTTDDVSPGYIDLPLWGRFPVVVATYEVEEKGKENGQCTISITFTRSGVTVEERWKFDGDGFDVFGKTALIAADLDETAIKKFEEALEVNADPNSLIKGFGQVKDMLIKAIGRIQGPISTLNQMTNEAVGITNLIAQGIRYPQELAEALTGAAASIVNGVMGIKNSFDDSLNYFKSMDNYRKILLQFLSADTFKTDMETVTIKQHITKDEIENLYRTVSLTAAGQILVQTEMTYQEARGFWALYEKLEDSVDQNNPEVYQAVRDMRIAVSQELSIRRLDNELVKSLPLPVPLLYLARIIGCGDEKLRQLNSISDSFTVYGDVIYV